MKGTDVVALVLGTIALIAVLGAIIYGVRLFTNATTPVVVVSPEPGVKCATMTTGDGVAISCWKVEL